MREAAGGSECPGNVSEAAHELPKLDRETPASRARAERGWALGLPGQREKREVLSAPHRAWFDPTDHSTQRTKGGRCQGVGFNCPGSLPVTAE